MTYPSISNNELLSKTDLVITPIERQASGMRKRLQTQVPIVAIPVGTVPDRQLKAKHIPMVSELQEKLLTLQDYSRKAFR